MDTPHMLEYTSAAVPTNTCLKPLTLEPGEEGEIRTPILSARYKNIKSHERHEHNLRSASSHIFYVMKGCGITLIPLKGQIVWKKGDVFTLPTCDCVIHHANDDSLLFYVNDEPLLRYLNVSPNSERFLPTHYKFEDMISRIKTLNEEEGANERNRNGILLSNSQMVTEGLHTATHTMWCLLNSLSHHMVQAPHRHNSIAIDLCIEASEDGKVYTLMGKELDEEGNIIDPLKMVWKTGHAFTTPPGWWHSHHNDSSEVAWVFPVQDAGLHTHMRTLDIHFGVYQALDNKRTH